MIDLNELNGVDQADYDRMAAQVTSQTQSPAIKVTLRQYAPKWIDTNLPPLPGQTIGIDAAFSPSYKGVPSLVVIYRSGSQVLVKYLPDDGSSGWVSDPTPLINDANEICAMSNDTFSALIFAYTYADGLGLKRYNSLEHSTVNYSNILHPIKFCAPVYGSELGTHVCGLTANGNWRLGFGRGAVANAPIAWSDIYWPYQVRSFDALSVTLYDTNGFVSDHYHVVAMITDLPSLIDVSTSGTKTVTTEQRVQGVVIFKFDPANLQWSDFFLVDVCDNKSGVAFSGLKLSSTSDAGQFFMTYAKQYTDKVGIAIAKSEDGLHWENPLFYSDSYIQSYAVATEPATVFVRSYRYLCLVSSSRLLRSVGTDFAGWATESLGAVQDITANVFSITGQIGVSRSITLHLAGLPSNSLLYGDRLLRCEVQYGMKSAYGTWTMNVLTGDVVPVNRDRQFGDDTLSITVKDTSGLPQMVGVSEAREWETLAFHGDNFAPTIEDDDIGTSGLGHIAVQTGTWTGGNKTNKTQGLNLLAENKEGFVLSTSISRALCGTFSAEMSFYQKLAEVAMDGSKPSVGLQGGEWAGLAFHALSQHDLWYVKFIPASGAASTFQLVKRVSRIITNTDGTTTTTHDEFVVASAVVDPDDAYSSLYSGRILIVWRYNMIRVYRHYPNGAATKIIEYEAKGMGNTDFSVAAASLPVLEGSKRGRPFTGGAAGYLGYSPKDGYTNVLANGDYESDAMSGFFDHRYGKYNAYHYNNWNYDLVTRVSSPKVNGTSSLRVVSVALPITTKTSGASIRTDLAVGQFVKDKPVRFRGNIYVYGTGLGDQDDEIRLYVCSRVHNEGEADPNALWNRHGTQIEITEGGKWIPFEMIYSPSSTYDWGEIATYVVGGPFDTAVTWYLDGLRIEKYTGTPYYIYFGNADYADGLHVFTAHDALHTLYAFAGQHKVERRYTMNQTLNGYSTTLIPLPYVANIGITRTSGKIGLCSKGTSPSPIEIDWTTSETKITIKSKAGIDAVRRIPIGPGLGDMRVAVTTQRNEGTLFKNDQTGVQDWITVAIYMNESLLMCVTAPLYDTSILGQKIYVGDGAAETVTIDQLPRPQQFFSIDPGENVAAGLSRIVGQSRAEVVYRYNDAVVIGRPVINHSGLPVKWTLPMSQSTRMQAEVNQYVPVHYRLVGAWTEQDVFDNLGMEQTWRHLFVKKDDPNLMTASEMQTEAAYVVAELRRSRQRRSVQIPFNPLMEYGDYVFFTNQYWTIESASFSISASKEGTLTLDGEIILVEADT
jgi:hypothetical protein